MDEIVKLLDHNLNYVSHELIEDTMYITVESNREKMRCPHCNRFSNKVHSRYKKSFKDLPIQGMKVVIVLINKKYFCKNVECDHTTFAETFDFIGKKAKKTKRLEKEIINLATNVSSVAASKFLRKNVVNVGKSTICELLKKNANNK